MAFKPCGSHGDGSAPTGSFREIESPCKVFTKDLHLALCLARVPLLIAKGGSMFKASGLFQAAFVSTSGNNSRHVGNHQSTFLQTTRIHNQRLQPLRSPAQDPTRQADAGPSHALQVSQSQLVQRLMIQPGLLNKIQGAGWRAMLAACKKMNSSSKFRPIRRFPPLVTDGHTKFLRNSVAIC